jgi:hypothetical protein
MTMKISLRTGFAAAVAACTIAACAERPGGTRLASAPPAPTLAAFQSEQELGAYLGQLAKTEALRREGAPPAATGFQELVPPAEPEAAVAAVAADAAGESVTNVQHAGVDEGGIVKVHGNHLVMLRRGRLFTVAVGGDTLQPVSAVDAFGPDVDADGTWYDELLVSGDAVVVIGFSYARGGTEVGLFRMGRDGRLSHRSTYHLRSNDYYSSRNYASRLIEGKLVFYTPLHLGLGAADPFARFPAMRRWHSGAQDGEFRRILPATRVYRAATPPAGSELALHTVTVCDLEAEEMDCQGSAVLGPPGRVFYVAPGAVYVWVTDERYSGRKVKTASMLYRIPLDGTGPSALGVTGSPVDQFSFLESADRHLNVLVRSEGQGDGMWRAERAEGGAALLRIPLAAFGDGGTSAAAELYRPLPVPSGHTFQNRFVGEYLLYGTGSGWGGPEQGGATLYAVPWLEGAPTALALPHGVDRIEAMGGDAVVVGTDGQNLHFSAIRLADRPELAQRYVSAGASQGELRSHGFFYKPDGRASGILGLPIRGPARPGYEHLSEGSASVLFLRNQASRFEELGELAAGRDGTADDGCVVSCVDWYGNARPLFLRGRIFALLGYEIVEGRVAAGRIRETRRISYAPRGTVARALRDRDRWRDDRQRFTEAGRAARVPHSGLLARGSCDHPPRRPSYHRVRDAADRLRMPGSRMPMGSATCHDGGDLMSRMMMIAAATLIAAAPRSAHAARPEYAAPAAVPEIAMEFGVLQQGKGGGKQEDAGGRAQGGGQRETRGGRDEARPSAERRQGGGPSARQPERAESSRGRASSSSQARRGNGSPARSDDARESRGSPSSSSARSERGSGNGAPAAASSGERGRSAGSANAASDTRGGRHRLGAADVRRHVAGLSPELRRMAGSSRAGERAVAGALARSRARGVDASAFDVRRDGSGLRVLNRSGALLLDLDDDRARDLGAWRLRRLGDRRPTGNAPAFCRSGAGHPVFGREWCLDRGFGLGSRAGTLWSRGGIDDVIWRRRTDDRLDRGGLIGALGDVVFGRLALQAVALGYDQPLVGFWVAQPEGPRILRVHAGDHEVAEIVDTDRDDRADVLYVVQPVW